MVEFIFFFFGNLRNFFFFFAYSIASCQFKKTKNFRLSRFSTKKALSQKTFFGQFLEKIHWKKKKKKKFKSFLKNVDFFFFFLVVDSERGDEKLYFLKFFAISKIFEKKKKSNFVEKNWKKFLLIPQLIESFNIPTEIDRAVLNCLFVRTNQQKLVYACKVIA